VRDRLGAGPSKRRDSPRAAVSAVLDCRPQRVPRADPGSYCVGKLSGPTHFALSLIGLLIGDRGVRKVIHSNFQQAHRLGGSNGVSAAEGLWMNLWKLWIVEELLTLNRRVGQR
jgi:hypothetical protein